MLVMLAKNKGKEPIVVECENEAFCLGRPQTGSGTGRWGRQLALTQIVQASRPDARPSTESLPCHNMGRKRVCANRLDHNRHEISTKISFGFKVHGLEIGRTPDQLAGVPPGFLEKHIETPPDTGNVECQALFRKQRLKPQKSGIFL